jgi:uncharacterized protein
MITQRPFWLHKSLNEMTTEEWESLCDGCGLCCMIRLEDEDTGEVALTRLACRYLDLSSCKCTDYANRKRNVPACITLKPHMVKEFGWLPETCAYRLIDEGKPLYPWHHLLTGDPESVHKAGISKRGILISEQNVPEDEWEDYII